MKRFLAALALIAFAVLPVSAQDYPSKPVRMIVPLAAGGIADNLARTLGQKITEATRQPVITSMTACRKRWRRSSAPTAPVTSS